LGFIVGETLTADPAGSTYKWYKQGVLIPNANLISYTPAEAGVYYVDVDGTESDRKTVFAVPFGKYTMTGADTNWKPNPDLTGTSYDEKVTIAKTTDGGHRFELTSTSNGLNEFLKFDILRWEPVSVPNTERITALSDKADYVIGYKLTITGATQHTWNNKTDASDNRYFTAQSPTYIYIYGAFATGKTTENAKNGDISKFLRTAPGSENIAPTDAGAKGRIYKRDAIQL